MALKNLPFKPGIYEEDTDRGVGAFGFWKDADHVRFQDTLPEKIGGWAKQDASQSFVGAARGVTDWQAISAFTKYFAFGTSQKLYVQTGGVIYDITPYASTGTLTNPFSTTNSSAVANVLDTAHGASAGDYVNFTGASAVGGITISGNYQITSVVDADNYRITHTSAATSTAGPGGGTVTYNYEIPTGVDDSAPGFGYGTGAYGEGTYGTPRSISKTLARTWALDTWGEDLIATHRDGKIYAWTAANGTSIRAQLIPNAPVNNIASFVSTEDRHVIALGAGGDPLLIQWSSQEDYNAWTTTITNTAGDKRLDVGSQIVTWAKIRGAHLIYTDSFVYSMQFSGPPYTFDFTPLGDCGGIRGPNSARAYEGVAYWMGAKEFYLYDGVVKVIPCTVKTRIFEDINSTQNAKVFCGINRQFHEIWWLYPSANSMENDRYVVYNLADKCWYYGSLGRTAFVGDSDIFAAPYAFGADGYVYNHELGVDDDGSAMTAYVESGDVELDPAGANFQHLGKFIPDFKTLTGSVDMTFNGLRYPQDSETIVSGPHAVTSSTKFINPRMRARQLSIKVSSDTLGANWRCGQLRVDLIPHGER